MTLHETDCYSAIGGVIIKLGYGKNIYQEHGKELIEMNMKRMQMINTTFAKFWLVDIFPIFRHIPAWFPGAGFRRLGLEATRLGKINRYWAFGMVEDAVVGCLSFVYHVTLMSFLEGWVCR